MPKEKKRKQPRVRGFDEGTPKGYGDHETPTRMPRKVAPQPPPRPPKRVIRGQIRPTPPPPPPKEEEKEVDMDDLFDFEVEEQVEEIKPKLGDYIWVVQRQDDNKIYEIRFDDIGPRKNKGHILRDDLSYYAALDEATKIANEVGAQFRGTLSYY